MVTKLLNRIESYIESSGQSFYLFAGVVNELEFFAEQNKSIFSDETRQQYKSIWIELEVLNACALEEWESLGKPHDFSNYWEDKYKKEALVLLTELCSFLKSISNSAKEQRA